MSLQLPQIPAPVNPPAGQWEFYIDENDLNLKLKDSAGNVTNLSNANVPVFGTQFQQVSEESITTTTGTGFINKVTLTTTNLPAGDYRLEWFYQWNYDSGTTDFRARVRNLTDVVDYMEQRQEPKDAGGSGPGGSDQRYLESGFVIRSLSGIKDIALEYAAGNAGTIAAIWNARLALWRVS